MPPVSSKGRTRLIAHRGFAAVFPENTLAAVRGAADQGADMVEVDCRECASGEVVVHHDETVDRLTTESGQVSEYSASALASMQVLGSEHGIPTLGAVVETLPRGLGLNIELKERNLARRALAEVADVSEEVIVSAFDRQVLEEAAAADQYQPLALLVDRRPRTAVRRARAADCSYVHPKAGLCLRSLLVRRAHRANLGVNAWTLRSRRMAGWLSRIGVDGLIADSPDVLGVDR
jgi:glycerophosphoryl diester phosphodiesterase